MCKLDLDYHNELEVDLEVSHTWLVDLDTRIFEIWVGLDLDF